MKSLAERHADRAQRKADNAAFSTASAVGGNLGLAMVRMTEAQVAFGNLSEDEKEELKASFADGFDNAGDETNLYDGAGSLKHAGIGEVNPLIVPPAAQTGDNIGGGVADNGWGELPEANAGPEQGSADGVALEAQAPETASGTAKPPKGKAQAPASE